MYHLMQNILKYLTTAVYVIYEAYNNIILFPIHIFFIFNLFKTRNTYNTSFKNIISSLVLYMYI